MYAPLDQTPPDDAPLNLSSSSRIPMSPEVASNLTGQVSWSFQLPPDNVYNTLIDGDEDLLRTNLASQESQNQVGDIASTLRKNPFAINPTTLAAMAAPKDPRSIIEKKYASVSLDHMLDYTDSSDEIPSAVQQTAKEDPTGLAEEMTYNKERLSWELLLKNSVEKLQSNATDQSYVGRAADFLKDPLSFNLYSEFKTRGLVPGTGFFAGGLLGDNWESQRKALNAMPYEQRIPTFLNIIDSLSKDNPAKALEFAQGMYGMSTEERYFANSNTLFALSNLPSLGSIAKNLIKPSIAKLITRKGINDIADAAAISDKPASVAIPEAAGKTVDAGIEETVNRIHAIETGRITPERLATETAMDIMSPKSLGASSEEVRGVVKASEERLAKIHDILDNPEYEYLHPAYQAEFNEQEAALNAYRLNNAPALKFNLSREIFSRLTEAYENNMGAFLRTKLNALQVQRIGNILADRRVITKVWEDIKGRTQGLSDNVINMTDPIHDPITGQHNVGVIFGRNSSELFNDMTEAFNTIEGNGLKVSMIEGKSFGEGGPGVSLGSQGGKWYGYVSRPMNEIQHYVRDFVIETAESKNSNHGILNQWGLPSWIRNPDDVLPYLESLNRKVAIFGPAQFRDVLAEHVFANIDLAKAKFRGQNWKDVFANLGKGSEFQRMLDHLQRAKDPVTGLPGADLSSVQDVYSFYSTHFGRAPDQIELDGYFAARRGMAQDYIFRNLSIGKNMARLGNEEHRLYTIGMDGKVYSKWFVGSSIRPKEIESLLSKDEANDSRINRLLTESPGIEFKEVNLGGRKLTTAKGKGTKVRPPLDFGIPNEAVIAYFGQHGGEEKIQRVGNFFKGAIGKEIAPKVASGEYKIIKMYNTELNPLNGFSNVEDDLIHYVITKNTETRPLSFKQIPQQPGFHIAYDHPWYTVQPKIRRSNVDGELYHHYEGDATGFLHENRAVGQGVAKIMNEVREHLLNNRETEAEQAGKQLPIGWKELRGWFDPTRGPGGEKFSARFSKEEPFLVKAKNSLSTDVDNTLQDKYSNFRDSTRTGSPARQFQVEFTGARDARDVMQITDEGTRFNPMYKYDPAQPLDPLTSMNRALTRITNSLYMDDVKVSSMENWLRRYKNIVDLKGLGDPAFMSAPFYHFNEAPIKRGVLDKAATTRAEAERWMIKQFTGTPSWIDNQLNSIQDKMMDSLYNNKKWSLNYNAAKIGSLGVSAIKDGPSFLRYMAFKFGIGMFTPSQFFVQLNSLVNIAGMSGNSLVEGYGKAIQGVAAATMHQYSRFNSNPAILATMDKKLSAFGWKSGEFMEARDILNGSGIHFVSNESNTQLGYTKTNSVVKGVANKFLDLGDVFFKEGDRHGRYAAVFAAYKEVRDANPISRLTELDKAKILTRADAFTGNMTQASKSALQMGPLSIPTQFLGFSMRMTELMVGKRLTPEQKFRLFGTYWAMYGLPVAFGIYSIPQFGDAWKKSSQDAGYDPNKVSVSSLVNEGAPSTFLKLVTGNTYNFGETYGNPGIDTLRDVFSKDKTVLETVGGASGSMLQGVIGGMDGYWKWVTTFLNGDDTAYGMTSDDFLRPLEASAAYGKYRQTLGAVNTGVWMNKNESVLKENVGVTNALFMGLTGLKPKDIDTQTIDKLSKDREEHQKDGLNSFIRNVHRAQDALKNNDPQQAKTFLNNARLDLAFSGYPDEKRPQAWSAALSGKTVPERKLWNYFMANVPPEEKAKNAEIYGNIMRNMQ